MRLLRLSLVVGGLFNVTMGIIFLNNRLLASFFSATEIVELRIFHSPVAVNFPAEPLHQLLIHGFGAGVVILGATLLYAVKSPHRLAPFIFFDGLGRLLFSGILFYYVKVFSLPNTILLFGGLELLLALVYIWGSWLLTGKKAKLKTATRA